MRNKTVLLLFIIAFSSFQLYSQQLETLTLPNGKTFHYAKQGKDSKPIEIHKNDFILGSKPSTSGEESPRRLMVEFKSEPLAKNHKSKSSGRAANLATEHDQFRADQRRPTGDHSF
jgi:hypothetical protein